MKHTSRHIDVPIEIHEVSFGPAVGVVKGTATCYYEPGDPGVRTFPNGDPGYPPDGPTCEVVGIEVVFQADPVSPRHGEIKYDIGLDEFMAMFGSEEIANIEEKAIEIGIEEDAYL